MDGKNVIVLGGSSGMGKATALRFVDAGARVWITGRHRDRLEEVVRARDSERLHGEACDATDAAALRALRDRIGPIDHLVVAAGGASGAIMGAFAELDPNDVRRGFDEKFWLHFQAAQVFAEAIRDGGSMTFVTAVSAQLAMPGTVALAAMNGAIESMVRPLARELAPRIRVNAVSPGVVDTAWWSFLPDQARQDALGQVARDLPLQRVGTPDDIASVIAMVAGNAFMTGLIVPCDGGKHLG
ncbi:MAG: SDR family oxidoreductase [Myxococcota bacterium]